MAITQSLIAAITCAKVLGNFDMPTFDYNEANSATFKVGAILVNSSGNLVEATSGAPPIAKIAGVALQAGQNNPAAPTLPNYGGTYPAGSALAGGSGAGTAEAVYPLLVVPPLPDLVFEGTFANNNADVAINLSDMWVRYGLTKDATSGFWYVDKNLTTTNANVVIVGVKNVQDITFGTTKGARVYFQFLTPGTIFGAQA